MLGLKPVVPRLGLLAAAAWLLALYAVPADASIVQALTLDELVEESEQILVGEVLLTESFVRSNGTLGTWHRVRVERGLWGVPPEDREVIIETLGGHIGDLAMRVEGEPTFEEGERVILFVRGAGPYTMARPVGMSQGVMRVSDEQGEPMVSQNQKEMMLVRRNAQGRLEKSLGALPRPVRLERFLQTVQGLIDQKARATQ